MRLERGQAQGATLPETVLRPASRARLDFFSGEKKRPMSYYFLGADMALANAGAFGAGAKGGIDEDTCGGRGGGGETT